MEQEIKTLIAKLKSENEIRSQDMNSLNISDYNHTVKVHCYNNTLEIIKQLETIITENDYFNSIKLK